MCDDYGLDLILKLIDDRLQSWESSQLCRDFFVSELCKAIDSYLGKETA